MAEAGVRAAATAERIVRLRRMRAVATGLLALMGAVFVLAGLAERRWSAAGYLRAFAEAAMVGGIADWFAVTALFRRPLGLPIPHTALIPRSQARIGAALGRFIVENFLSPRVLDARLREWELASWGGRWLSRPEVSRQLSERLVRFGPDVLKAFPQDDLERLLASGATAAVRAVPAAPAASALLAAVWGEDRAGPLIERAAELLGGYLQEHQEVVLDKVQAQSWHWLPSWVDQAIARRITAGLVQLLSDVRSPDHPWRARLDGLAAMWIERLASDPDLRARGETLKADILANPRFRAEVRRLWMQLREGVEGGRLFATGGAPAQVEAVLRAFGAWLASDEAMQRTLNLSARSLVRSVLAPRRQDVGRFIAQVVEGWDAQSLVARLELQVGPDLQYIRINGALVGGCVGLLLFTLSRLLRLA
jgi:uncharacterized membrane-anchored protein YjiN (DUF445 family)